MVTVFTGVLIFGNTVPFYSLYSAKQLPGATMIAVLIIVLCLNFINAIIWSNNHIASWWNGHILCDIEVSIKQVLSTMVASSTACMTGNLAKAVDVENNPMMFESSAMRRRRIVFELIFIFGIPFIQLCTHYVVQSGRYAIVAVYGCTDVIDRSWPTLVIFIWPLVFSIINCYYAVLVIIRLQRHRGNLSTTLSSSGSSFTARRFMKLFVLCLLFFTLQLPATAMFFFFNLNNSLPMHSYSWSQVHDPKLWPYIMYFTSEQVPTQQYYGWPVVIMGLTSFAFYGCNVEATERYRLLLVKCGVGRIWPAVLAPRERRRRRGSGNESRASWTSHLDVIGKTVKYFDNKRKHSHASTEEHENV
ncbi:pheromone A receptor-domain-containing protein [Calycina marina]|uniref:Pheromone A receptor-domain-containing protein n=1 Tax=Calycina marina TaxID=1763456 RepID=A0A9P8CFE2_9HELO|nr:pheromone A receptor-domain-containing protein [Calycina marina]